MKIEVNIFRNCDILIVVGDFVKNKTIFFLIVGIFLFLAMLFCLKFEIAAEIDDYSLMIHKTFANPSFRNLFYFITNLMTFMGIFFIVIGTMFFLRKKEAQKEILLFVFTILCCVLSNHVLKIIIQRSRPVDRLLVVSGYSFPSGHSSISMVVYGFLILLIRKYYHGKRKNLWIGICVSLILLTGISRIYFHYLTDVIAGFSLGLILLSLSNLVLKRLTNSEK